jgi:hypothetical protein
VLGRPARAPHCSRIYLIARAEAIPADVRDTIKGTKLDTGVYLDSLKGMEPGWVFGGNLLLSH